MAPKRFWAELKSSEFAALDPDSTVTILPVAATEQHGPHLPVMTDIAIGEGLIKTVFDASNLALMTWKCTVKTSSNISTNN